MKYDYSQISACHLLDKPAQYRMLTIARFGMFDLFPFRESNRKEPNGISGEASTSD